MKKIFIFLTGILFQSLLMVGELKAEQTLSIIKPEAVAEHRLGEIEAQIEKGGLTIVAAKMIRLDEKTAKAFYGEHKERPFYSELVKYMTSGPIFAQVLEGPDAITTYRSMMGDTNPQKAEKETLRATFGTDMQYNAVHGSDSAKAAQREIAFFFAGEEIFGP